MDSAGASILTKNTKTQVKRAGFASSKRKTNPLVNKVQDCPKNHYFIGVYTVIILLLLFAGCQVKSTLSNPTIRLGLSVAVVSLDNQQQPTHLTNQRARLGLYTTRLEPRFQFNQWRHDSTTAPNTWQIPSHQCCKYRLQQFHIPV